MRKSFLVLLAAFASLPSPAMAGDPNQCSPMDQAATVDSGDSAACCDGEGSDDGCGPQDCSEDSSSTRTCGNPVDVLTGFMWVNGTDIDLAAPAGPAIELRRTYASAWAQSKGGRSPGVLGPGWAHTYLAHLEFAGGGTPAAQVTHRRGDGGTQVFTLNGGAYTSRHPLKALRFDSTTQLYSLERGDSGIEVFDAEGKLKTIRNADGGEVQLFYTGEDATCSAASNRPAGQLCRVDFVFGQQLWFWYTSATVGIRLDHVSWDNAGTSIVSSYGYDTEGYLTSATALGGAKLTYEYAFTHSFPRGAAGSVKLLTKVTDAEGYALETFTYKQRPVSQSRVEGHTTQDGFWNVDVSGLKKRESSVSSNTGTLNSTWQNGKVHTSCRAGADGQVKVDRCQEFDVPDSFAEARCERNSDGYFARTERDSLGRATSVVKGLSACAAPSATEQAKATSYGYVANSNRLAFEQKPSVDPAPPAGFRATTIYDFTTPSSQTDPFCGQESCQTPEAYNKADALTPQVQQQVRIGRTMSVDGTWSTRVTAIKNEYGPLGQRTKTTGPRRDVDDSVSYDYYDASSGGPEAGRLKAVRRGATILAGYSDYAPCGKARQVTDEAGNATVLDYDAAGRVLFVQRPGDVGKTSYQYRSSGTLWKVTFPSGRWISYEPDPLGRVGSVEWHDDAGTLIEKVAYLHVGDSPTTPDGRLAGLDYYAKTALVRKVRYTYSAAGEWSDEKADAAWTVRMFDEEKRLAATMDGNHLQGGFWESRNVEHVYDALGELERVKRLISGQWVDMSRFTRDAQGNVATVTDASGIESQYRFDDFGNLVEYTSTSTGTRRFEFDEAGNLMKERTPDGTDITRTYDARNRLLTVHANDVDERYTYDSDEAAAVLDCATGQPLGASAGAGKLTKVEDASGATFFGYSSKGDRAFEALLIPGASCARAFRWTRNENGELTNLRYPTGHEVTIDYVGSHLPSKVTARVGSRTVTLASNIAIQGGRLAGYTAGNGMLWSQSRQADGWPDDLKITLADKRIVRRQRTGSYHDGAGNLTQIDEELKSWGVKYSYEPDLNVLSKVEGPFGTQDYTVAPSGDRATANGVAYCYEEGTHRLATAGTTSFDYSPSGATWRIKEAEGTRTLCYDAKEQLVRVVGQGGEVVGQTNNWQHRRVVSISPVNELRTDFRFDGTQLLEERSFASLKAQFPRPTVEYVYLLGQPIAALHSEENADGTQSEGEVAFLFAGRMAEVLLEANESAQVTWWHDLEGFGPAQSLGRISVQQTVQMPPGGPAIGVPGARAIRVHFKDFQMPCGYFAARMTDDGFWRAGTYGPEKSGSFWTEWMHSGSVTPSIATTGCAAGQKPTAEIDQFEVDFGSSEVQTVNFASANPYPAAGQQFEIDFGDGGYAYFDRNTPATCDRLEARDSVGQVLWQGPSDKSRAWTTRLSGKLQVGIWGQGCNVTEKASGFSVTKLVLDIAPPGAVGSEWPGQNDDAATGLMENLHRYYHPSTGRYLQPEPLAAWPGYVLATTFVGQPETLYAYAGNSPLLFIDPTGLLTPLHEACLAEAGSGECAANCCKKADDDYMKCQDNAHGDARAMVECVKKGKSAAGECKSKCNKRKCE